MDQQYHEHCNVSFFPFAFFLVLFLSLRRLLVWFIITILIAFIKILFHSVCWPRVVNKRRGIWCASPSCLSFEISLSQMVLASALSIGGDIEFYFPSSLPTFEESSPLVTLDQECNFSCPSPQQRSTKFVKQIKPQQTAANWMINNEKNWNKKTIFEFFHNNTSVFHL